MSKIDLKIVGDAGEVEVIELVNCPNCNRKLMLLPKNYPLYDIQCTACFFKAQVKSSSGKKPHRVVRGAGWDIMDKVLKSGSLVPPLITNTKWREKDVERHEIRFYPFIKKSCLVKYTADIKSADRVYRMFNYDLQDMIYFTIYSK